MPTIGKWALQRSVRGWISLDGTVRLVQHQHGWYISSPTTVHRQRLLAAGLDNQLLTVSFAQAKKIAADALGCSPSFKQVQTTYHILLTPLSLRRQSDRYWSFIVLSRGEAQEVRTSAQWKEVMPKITGHRYPSRNAALEALDTAIAEYMETSATVQERAGVQWIRDFNAAAQAAGISLN